MITNASKTAVTTPVGITMGCPASIGPEIILKFHRDGVNELSVPPVVIGDYTVLADTAAALKFDIAINHWQPGTPTKTDCLNLLGVSHLESTSVRAGKPNRMTGEAMAGYVDTAISLCRSKQLCAMVTCPISKSALKTAGFAFPGHTEMLAARTGTRQVAMMLAGSRLRIVLVTIHCSIAQVAPAINRDAIVGVVSLTNQALKTDFGVIAPRIAVAALNPHSGEDGMFGHEEIDIIKPAITDCVNAGISASGPHPPDTVFYQAAAGRFDIVVCMYHDQGLIPFKLLHFDDGVNITIGLPIIRTSVDHGTAYDIAGRGVANHQSLKNAVTLAAQIAVNRQTITVNSCT